MNRPQEPSAAHRAGAKWLREMYVALIMEGFTGPEAIQIVGAALAAMVVEGTKGQS